MDPIKILKFQAMHKYKKHHQPLMLSNLFLYSLTAIICVLFCFSPSWLLPSLASSMKVFVLVSVPKIGSVFLSSKFVFILGNLIVVALIGESKIFSTSSSNSQANNIVEQYERMKRAQTLHSFPIQQQKEPKNFDTSSVEVEQSVIIIKKACGDLEGVEEKRWDDEEREEVEEVKEDIKEGDDNDDDEEFNFLDDDDDQKLSQRADDFIARVNERRRFELKLDI